MEMLFKLNPHIPRGDTFQEEGTEMQSGFSGKAEGAGKEQNALVGSGCSGLWHRGWADRNRWSQLASVLADHYKEFRYPSRKARYNGLTDVQRCREWVLRAERVFSTFRVFQGWAQCSHDRGDDTAVGEQEGGLSMPSMFTAILSWGFSKKKSSFFII